MRAPQTVLPSILLLLSTTVALSFQHQSISTTKAIRNHQHCIHHETYDRHSTRLSMISFGNKNAKDEELPRDVKEAVSRCRAATQEALQNRLSRMDVEFPVGTDFGVEPKSKAGRKKRSLQEFQDEPKGAPTKDTLDRSDRELARLFVEMFQPVGGDNIAVAFVNDDLADRAKSNWDTNAASCKILAMNRSRSSSGLKKKKRKKVLTSAKGFASKLAAEIDDSSTPNKASGPFALPDNTEVALFVAPGPKELVVIEKICNEVGMGTLVVLLNARLDGISNFGTPQAEELFLNEFESVFRLAAAPQEEAPGCLLYRAYPGEWVVARKPNVGQPKPILSQKDKPTSEACRDAFDNLEITDMEKNVEGFVENVAGWFR